MEDFITFHIKYKIILSAYDFDGYGSLGAEPHGIANTII